MWKMAPVVHFDEATGPHAGGADVLTFLLSIIGNGKKCVQAKAIELAKMC